VFIFLIESEMNVLRSMVLIMILFVTSYASSFAAFTNVDCTAPADRLVLGGGVNELWQVDCEFLEQIYDTTSPAGWTNNTGWDTVSDVNSWFGVSRNAGGVSQLVMANNNMTGDISSLDFTGITELGLFILSSNTLSWDLSSWDITNLSNISDFEIQYNAFNLHEIYLVGIFQVYQIYVILLLQVTDLQVILVLGCFL